MADYEVIRRRAACARNERSELQVLIDFLLPGNPNAYAQM